MTGEDELQPAADADTVDGRDHRNRQLLDAIQKCVDRLQRVDDILLVLKRLELANVGTNDETALLARDDDETANALGARLGFNAFDDGVEFLDRPAAERIRAFAFPVEYRPRDIFAVD